MTVRRKIDFAQTGVIKIIIIKRAKDRNLPLRVRDCFLSTSVDEKKILNVNNENIELWKVFFYYPYQINPL